VPDSGKVRRKAFQERGQKVRKFTAYIERDTESGLYVGIVPQLPGAHTQAATLDELQVNLREVVELCLEEMGEESIRDLPEFVGIQQVEAA
jgi:predicted RNase H-like HicB family nuclease